MNSLVFSPILPLPILLILGGLVVGLTFWSILRSSRGVWFRFLAGLILLASLLNPQANHKDTRTLKDIALILVDQSSSQTLTDRQTQIEKATAYLKKETDLYPDLDVRTLVIRPDGREDTLGTRVVSQLKQALSTIDPKRYAGAVLISDGQIHDVKEFDAIPGPLHLLLSGSKKDIDRRIEVVDAPRYGLVGEPLKIRVRVHENGAPAKNIPVRLIRPDGSRLIFPSSEKEVQEITFTPEHAGPSVLIVETNLLDGEINTSNNKTALNINGVRDRLQVLLVSGMPHQGQRTWRNILRSDPSVDLVHFTILRPSEKEDFTPLNELSLIAFPVRELFEDKLNDFDLIIFDRYYKHNVLSEHYFENITEYVRKGGAILVSAGPDFTGPRSLSKTRLNSVLPVRSTGTILENEPYRLKRSDIGKRHPITARLGNEENSWGRWFRLIETAGHDGKAILERDKNNPVLIVNRVKEGRMAMLLSDQIWLWARGFDGGGPHGILVRNLVHWLMKEPDLEEEKLSLHPLSDGKLEIRRQTLSAKENNVSLKRPDGSLETITLSRKENGLLSFTTEAKEPGIYRAEAGKHNAVITIGRLNPKEFEDPRASSVPLSGMIAQIGGSTHWIEDGLPRIKRTSSKAKTAGSGWINLAKNRAEAVVGVKSVSLLPGWLVFLAVVGLIAMGWWRESR